MMLSFSAADATLMLPLLLMLDMLIICALQALLIDEVADGLNTRRHFLHAASPRFVFL